MERPAGLVVHTEERDVEVIARIREVVGIASEVSNRFLGHEHQADVAVAPVAVQGVAPPLVQRGDVAAQVRDATLALSDLLHLAVACGEQIHPGLPGRRGCDLLRYVAQADELIHIQVGHPPLVFRALRVEPSGEEVFPGPRNRGCRLARTMVIGHYEAARRHERRRAIGKPQRREPQPLQPLRRRREPVFLPEVVERRVLERPHLSGVEAPWLRRRVDRGSGGGGGGGRGTRRWCDRGWSGGGDRSRSSSGRGRATAGRARRSKRHRGGKRAGEYQRR